MRVPKWKAKVDAMAQEFMQTHGVARIVDERGNVLYEAGDRARGTARKAREKKA